MEKYSKDKYKPHRFNKTASFGNIESRLNKVTGLYDKVFVEKFTSRYSYDSKSLRNMYELAGTRMEDKITIIIRDTDKISGCQAVKLRDGKTYLIDYINYDDDNYYMKYLIINLKEDIPNGGRQ